MIYKAYTLIYVKIFNQQLDLLSKSFPNNRPSFLQTKDFLEVAKIAEIFILGLSSPKSRKFWNPAPRHRLFLAFLPDFLREIFPLTFPLCSFGADFPTCRDLPCDGRDFFCRHQPYVGKWSSQEERQSSQILAGLAFMTFLFLFS